MNILNIFNHQLKRISRRFELWRPKSDYFAQVMIHFCSAKFSYLAPPRVVTTTTLFSPDL